MPAHTRTHARMHTCTHARTHTHTHTHSVARFPFHYHTPTHAHTSQTPSTTISTQLPLVIHKRTIHPGDGDTLSKGDQHEGEAGAVPIHDLQDVDTTLADAGQAKQELHEASGSCHQCLLVTQLVWELVDQAAEHCLKHSKLQHRKDTRTSLLTPRGGGGDCHSLQAVEHLLIDILQHFNNIPYNNTIMCMFLLKLPDTLFLFWLEKYKNHNICPGWKKYDPLLWKLRATS